VIAATLRLPSAFDFDSLLKLDALGTAEDHELYSLLRIFLDGGLIEFTSWAQTHAHSLEEYSEVHLLSPMTMLSPTLSSPELDRTQLNRKIRLLTLASLAYKHVGQDLPYAKIATALQVDVSEVEGWVIDSASSFLSLSQHSFLIISSQSFALAYCPASYPRLTKPCTLRAALRALSNASNGKRWKKGSRHGRADWPGSWRSSLLRERKTSLQPIFQPKRQRKQRSLKKCTDGSRDIAQYFWGDGLPLSGYEQRM
jgi:hypothetical protein